MVISFYQHNSIVVLNIMKGMFFLPSMGLG